MAQNHVFTLPLPQPAVYTTLAGQTVLHVAAHQEGAEYCVRAQSVLDSQLYSRSTDTQCVTITGTHTHILALA